MLYSVEVKKNNNIDKKSFFKRINSYFKNNDVSIYTYEFNNLKIKNIIYEDNFTLIKWNKIIRELPSDFSNLLLENTISIPSGISHFKPTIYNEILCQNSFINLLSILPKNNHKINIGILDKCGNLDILNLIHNHTNNITVYTENIDYYSSLAKDILEKYGIYINISNNINFLSRCNIIFSPDKITSYLPTNNKTFIFTPFLPAVNLNCTVINKFEIKLPSPYIHIKPKNLSDTYFASALFELENCNDLYNLIPCHNLSCGKSYTNQEIHKFIISYNT